MKLHKIVIATELTDEMVQFYNGVFGSALEPFEAMGTTLYRGNIAEIDLLFCPNEVLGIKAEKNRQQLSFVVDDLEEVVGKVGKFGGEQADDIQKTPNGKVCGVTDPDGNTIEFVEMSN